MKVPLSDSAKEILNSPSASHSFAMQMAVSEKDAEGKPLPIVVYVPETGKTYTFTNARHLP